MSARVIHFVSQRPIPEFLYYAPPASIAKLEELIAVTTRVGKKGKEIYGVENLLRLYGHFASASS